MSPDSFTTLCCQTTAHMTGLLVGASLMTGGLIYAWIVIRRLLDVPR